MAKISATQVELYRTMARDWLATKGLKPEDVKTGSDAWTVAHRAEITKACYQDRDIVDAHIQTALEQIFPHAVFKDRKRY